MSFSVTPQEENSTQTQQLDPTKLEQLLAAKRAEQSMPLAVAAGLAASIIASLIWAAITYITNFQIGFMAIGVGFLVGYAVNLLGKGMSSSFGVIGAVFALFGCLLGNFLAMVITASMEEGSSFTLVMSGIAANPSVIVDAMIEAFSPIDLVFYGIAIYEGFKLSIRRFSSEEIASVQAGLQNAV